jgi:hypothetical protein
MQAMILYNKQDFSILTKEFPDLYYDKNNKTVKGELSFNAHYKNTGNKGNDRWKIFPCTSKKNCLEGCYEIEINLNANAPKVYEPNGKIKKLAKKLGKSVNDLHLYNGDNQCCLGLGINNNSSLSRFVVDWVYPYFVWQAYFKKHNKVPPCGEYPHNRKSAQKEYEYDMKSLGVNDSCPCKSGKKYKKCCKVKK